MPRGQPWLLWRWSKLGSLAENCVCTQGIELLVYICVYMKTDCQTYANHVTEKYILCCDVYYHVSGNENVEQ